MVNRGWGLVNREPGWGLVSWPSCVSWPSICPSGWACPATSPLVASEPLQEPPPSWGSEVTRVKHPPNTHASEAEIMSTLGQNFYFIIFIAWIICHNRSYSNKVFAIARGFGRSVVCWTTERKCHFTFFRTDAWSSQCFSVCVLCVYLLQKTQSTLDPFIL